MSHAAAPGRHRAYRHFLTAARGGFQTVAAAAGLAPALVAQIEQEVGSFALPDGDRGHPSLQLRRWDDDFLLLTRFEPRQDGGDGRRGNYLAESLLVPTAWLAEAEWDVAAAVLAIEWRGAAGLGPAEDAPAELADEPLPPLAPGPLDRLAALAERAPGDLLDHLLLGLVGWAARGERLSVVEARAERPAEIERAMLLLPLALPPSCRAGRRGGRLCGLELRTRGPAHGMPPVDLAGVAAGDLDRAAAAGGTVIDLGGRLPLDPTPDLEGYDYAQWAKTAIREGRWEEMAAVYAGAVEVPAAELFRHFAELSRGWRAEADGGAAGGPRRGGAGRRAAAAAGPRASARTAGPPPGAPRPAAADLPGDAPPAPLEDRRARWQARRELESAAARGHDGWRGEAEALVAALESENRRAADELRDELAAVGERIAERLRTEREALWNETVRAVETAALESQKRFHADVERLLERLRAETDAALGEVRRESGRREKRLAGGGARAGIGGGGGARRRRAAAFGGRRAAAVAGGVVLLALLGWLAWRTWRPAAADDPAPGARRGAPQAAERVLLPRLAEPATARALLLRARDTEAVAEPAASTALALLLADAPPPSAAERCLLLQAALHRRGLGPADAPLAVDGACGEGTAATLGEATAGSCCGALPAPAGGAASSARAACFLGAGLGIAEAERCAGADPFAPGRRWSGDQAARLLALLRHAAENAAPGARPDAERLRIRHDLAASPAVAERATAGPVTAEEAALLLDLARRLAAGGRGADAGEVDALLDALGASAGGASAGGGAAPPGG